MATFKLVEEPAQIDVVPDRTEAVGPAACGFNGCEAGTVLIIFVPPVASELVVAAPFT